MKRTVKAWGFVTGDIVYAVRKSKQRTWLEAGTRQITRLMLVTYDDGKPAKRRKRGGK